MIGFLRAQENEFRQQELGLERQEMQNFQTLMANQQQHNYAATTTNVTFRILLVGFCHHRTLQIKSGCVFTL